MNETQALFKNHLEFLATHRGKVTALDDAFTVESDNPGFNYAVLGKNGDRALLDRFQKAVLIPWSGPWSQEPVDARFKSAGADSYMLLRTNDISRWRRNRGLEIVVARDERGMELFTEAQARGFIQDEAAYQKWKPWLAQWNNRNLTNKTQFFYVALLDGRPVGSTLMVDEGDTAGIYAVATPPQYRKQAIATTLMARAIEEALARGRRLVMLATERGSYAESLYEKLGFEKIFESRVFIRNP